jgi:imidazolonepropionase-like amidohydrolase
MMRVADGEARVLAAVREQLRQGASQIKVMAGGGVASLYDPLYTMQFTPRELRAAVDAAETMALTSPPTSTAWRESIGPSMRV